ncbi:DUF4375 domain-containing protein [Coraliomargarita algicola]|uniref:DUF4375 domain-containing protein n=1 Tax=Coraliomargarita algicola TaxID=3092156 RepID=A0ABZ0RJ17_9BACT|nr:DUF4375 domain-containing protein [Coraliomargarita sp. J2-16]WPJ95463.1 DUF4375 domain-containing protein [Coraliomargarita sp. J2-16]
MVDIEKVLQERGREELFGAVVRDLFENVCRDHEPFAFYSKRMSEGERMVILIWSLSCEAANGGIRQFLSNDSGNDFDETYVHLVRIGADEQVAALDRVSNRVFGGAVPSDRESRRQLLWNFCGEDDSDPDWERKENEAEVFFDEVDEVFGWCEAVKEMATDFIIQNQKDFHRNYPDAPAS